MHFSGPKRGRIHKDQSVGGGDITRPRYSGRMHYVDQGVTVQGQITNIDRGQPVQCAWKPAPCVYSEIFIAPEIRHLPALPCARVH